jgi:crystallin alpha B
MPLIDDFFRHTFLNRDFLVAPLATEDAFEISLNVQHFKPEEITVKVTEDNVVVVEAKHEEKKDETGSVLRHFVKKCVIPSGYDGSNVKSQLYSDGILTVSAPRIKSGDNKGRNIPVTRVKSEKASLKSKL